MEVIEHKTRRARGEFVRIWLYKTGYLLCGVI